tara:strand:+ start:6013 stop:6717 length:705 start_codon:yes stop_codon:yes gene_type:complete
MYNNKVRNPYYSEEELIANMEKREGGDVWSPEELAYMRDLLTDPPTYLKKTKPLSLASRPGYRRREEELVPNFDLSENPLVQQAFWEGKDEGAFDFNKPNNERELKAIYDYMVAASEKDDPAPIEKAKSSPKPTEVPDQIVEANEFITDYYANAGDMHKGILGPGASGHPTKSWTELQASEDGSTSPDSTWVPPETFIKGDPEGESFLAKYIIKNKPAIEEELLAELIASKRNT